MQIAGSSLPGPVLLAFQATVQVEPADERKLIVPRMSLVIDPAPIERFDSEESSNSSIAGEREEKRGESHKTFASFMAPPTSLSKSILGCSGEVTVHQHPCLKREYSLRLKMHFTLLPTLFSTHNR